MARRAQFPCTTTMRREGRLLASSALRFVAVAAWCVATIAVAAGSAHAAHAVAQTALPFVVLHGLGDACSNAGLLSFVRLLSDGAGATGTCVEIGNGMSDSWLMRLDKQTDHACAQIQQLPGLSSGFNLVGLSQGALIGRALIQMCDMPQVHSFVSIGGPHAGVASIPQCVLPPVCRLIDSIIRLGVYSEVVQDVVAPAGFVKIPTDLPAYLAGCKYLPLVNNELPARRNASFVQRMRLVQRVALIKFSGDTVLYPAETAHFGFFAPNDFSTLLPFNQTALYLEDSVGLRWLVEQRRVDFISLPGNHLYLPATAIRRHILPYLQPPTGDPSPAANPAAVLKGGQLPRRVAPM